MGQQLGYPQRYAPQETLRATVASTSYRAVDALTGREVLLTVVRGVQEEGAVRSFLEGMERLRGLSHPEVVAVLDYGREGDLVWVATELLPWPSLRQRMREPLSPGEALRLLGGVTRALEGAHREGIVHGGLRPSSLLVGPGGEVKVAEFGLSSLERSVHPLVQDVAAVAYAAPEVLEGGEATPPADIYSLGVLAYELLTGSLPFSGPSASVVRAKKGAGPPPAPSRRNPALRPAVDPVLLKALSASPWERFRTAGELLSALEAALGALPLGGGPGPTPATADGEAPGGTPASLGCPLCGHLNPPGTRYCLQCWAQLLPGTTLAPEEATARRRHWHRLRRRALLLQVGLVALALSALGAWAGVRATVRPVMPPPTSAVSALSGPGEWAMHQGGPGHLGVAQGAPLLRGDAVALLRTGAPLGSPPAMAGGRLFLATGEGRVVALDPSSGALLWEAPVSGPVDSAPAAAGGLVFLGLREGKLLALEAETGSTVWDFDVGGHNAGSPTVYQGVLYVGSGGGVLYALDALTGELRWSYEADAGLLASPAVVDDVVAVGSANGFVHMVDRHTGEKRFIYEGPSAVLAAPVASEELLFAATTEGEVVALDWRHRERAFEKGLLYWRYRFHRWGYIKEPPVPPGQVWATLLPGEWTPVSATPALAQGVLYIGSANGSLYALEASSGRLLWQASLDGPVNTSPVVMGDAVLVGTGHGLVYALSARGLGERWRVRLDGPVTAGPVVAGGRAWVGTARGTLYAIR